MTAQELMHYVRVAAKLDSINRGLRETVTYKVETTIALGGQDPRIALLQMTESLGATIAAMSSEAQYARVLTALEATGDVDDEPTGGGGALIHLADTLAVALSMARDFIDAQVKAMDAATWESQRLAGSVRSPRKTEAARANGAKGGRPIKTIQNQGQ